MNSLPVRGDGHVDWKTILFSIKNMIVYNDRNEIIKVGDFDIYCPGLTEEVLIQFPIFDHMDPDATDMIDKQKIVDVYIRVRSGHRLAF